MGRLARVSSFHRGQKGVEKEFIRTMESGIGKNGVSRSSKERLNIGIKLQTLVPTEVIN
jgi:hypothetical protein